MVTGPFEDNSFVNKNILLAIEGCGTGTFAYVVFIKILPKQSRSQNAIFESSIFLALK